MAQQAYMTETDDGRQGPRTPASRLRRLIRRLGALRGDRGRVHLTGEVTSL